MIWKRIARTGSGYYITLPKKLIEFYGWDKRTVFVEVRGEQIIIREAKGVTITRTKIPHLTQITTGGGKVVPMLPVESPGRPRKDENHVG